MKSAKTSKQEAFGPSWRGGGRWRRAKADSWWDCQPVFCARRGMSLTKPALTSCRTKYRRQSRCLPWKESCISHLKESCRYISHFTESCHVLYMTTARSFSVVDIVDKHLCYHTSRDFVWLFSFQPGVRGIYTSLDVPWLLHVWHDSLIYNTWHDSFKCAPWPLHMCDMSPECVWQHSFMCVARQHTATHCNELEHISSPLECVWQHSFICVARLPTMCDLTPWCMLHDFLHFFDITYSCAWHASLQAKYIYI